MVPDTLRRKKIIGKYAGVSPVSISNIAADNINKATEITPKYFCNLNPPWLNPETPI